MIDFLVGCIQFLVYYFKTIFSAIFSNTIATVLLVIIVASSILCYKYSRWYDDLHDDEMAKYDWDREQRMLHSNPKDRIPYKRKVRLHFFGKH
jgi:hypothetical protein